MIGVAIDEFPFLFWRNPFAAAFAKNDFELAPPMFGEGDEFPLDLGRKIAQHGFVRRVDAQSRRGKDEARWKLGNFGAGKVALSFESREGHTGRWRGLAVRIERSNSNPVINGLQRQMQVLAGL